MALVNVSENCLSSVLGFTVISQLGRSEIVHSWKQGFRWKGPVSIVRCALEFRFACGASLGESSPARQSLDGTG